MFRNVVLEAKARDSKSSIIPDEELTACFGNLQELLALNSELLKDFEDRVENWATCQKIADVIVKKGPFLKLYTVYLKNFTQMVQQFEDCCNKYNKFGKLVKESNRMKENSPEKSSISN